MDKAFRDSLPVLLSDLDADDILRRLVSDCAPPLGGQWAAYAPPEEEFVQALEARGNGRYTSFEARSIHRWLAGKMSDQGVFGLIAEFAKEDLREVDGEVVCRHEHILRWRDTTHPIGQMPFVCAYQARKDCYAEPRLCVNSPVVLKTDNLQLHIMLEQGFAENHHHLKGSSPAFLLAWISLMNDMEDRTRDFKKAFPHSLYEAVPPAEFYRRMYARVWKAAYIRAYLFARMWDRKNILESIEQSMRTVLAWPSELCEGNVSLLKDIITAISEGAGANLTDYALPLSRGDQPCGDELFSGEQTLLYRAFWNIFQNTGVLTKFDQDLFYAYLIISSKMRRELVQCNGRSGFENFRKYQDRKEVFIEKRPRYRPYQYLYPIEQGLRNKKLLKFETRFVPGCTMKNMLKKKREIEDVVRHIQNLNLTSTGEALSSDKLYLVAHIPKGMEPEEKTSSGSCVIKNARNVFKRQEARAIALSLEEYLNKGYDTFVPILGIDACNSEMGCRPEVFAQSFRYLREIRVTPTILKPADRKRSLRITYHVGEDFLDIADGLRAIDEAMLFFDMRAGDRLGHTLALGLDPQRWYGRKGRRIFLPRQDLLDNAVWMLHNLRGEGLLPQRLEHELEQAIQIQYNHVYRKNLPFQTQDFSIGSQDYYRAWMLRGDDPNAYRDAVKHEEFLNRLDLITPGFDGYRYLNAGTQAFNLDGIRRSDPGARQLYMHYHFNKDVRRDGEELVEYKISGAYIDAVCQLQRVMARRIAQANIGIETNPTSNYLISSVERYEEHPILAFNDAGLRNAPGNPHLSISINTDDLGVFETSLENEYALLARALEQSIGDNEKPRYAPSDICDWLDRVRVMGLRQSWKANN